MDSLRCVHRYCERALYRREWLLRRELPRQHLECRLGRLRGCTPPREDPLAQHPLGRVASGDCERNAGLARERAQCVTIGPSEEGFVEVLPVTPSVRRGKSARP